MLTTGIPYDCRELALGLYNKEYILLIITEIMQLFKKKVGRPLIEPFR